MFVDGFLDLRLGCLNGIGSGRIEAAVGSRTPRGGPELHWDVVALADAAGGEAEPVGEDATALVVRIVGQESVEAVLLLTATPIPAEHLLKLVGALLPVHVLFKGIQVEEGQDLTAGVVGPKRSHHLVLDGTGISVKG